MKRVIIRIVLGVVLCCGVINATSEFRTPLSVSRGHHHYPLNHVGSTWWFDQTCEGLSTKDGNLYCPIDGEDTRKDSPWSFSTFKAAYYRAANEAFLCPSKDCVDAAQAECDTTDCNFKDSKKRGSLASLWFGKDQFKGAEAFAGGALDSVTDPSGNPFLSFSRMSPRFDYNEWGVVFGAHAECRLGDERKWRVGSRISMPFKVVEIEQNLGCGANALEEGLENVIAVCPFNLDADATGNSVDYAYRLDFLSSLVRVGLPTTQNAPIVEYGTGAAPDQTKIAGVPVGFDSIMNENPPVFVVKSTNGMIPEKTLVPNTNDPQKFAFGKVADGPTILPADGSGVQGDVFHFDATKDYLATLGADTAAQSTLFVVPRIQTDVEPAGTGDPQQLNNNGVAIFNAVQELLTTMQLTGQASAVSFFQSCCIDLCRHERTLGVGDLDFEMYGGYGAEDNAWFTNLIAGVRFPTGRDQKDARRLYRQPTGNGGHYEVKVGAESGFKPLDWFGFMFDVNYHHVFDNNVEKAAPFKGATVRNIGPCVKADVSWDYFDVHADLTLFHPRNQDLGCSIGYEFFAKRKDRVKLCATTAVDCLGRTNELDATILEDCTDSHSHKIRAEMFHRWGFGALFAGGSHVVAGRNVMQETELHLGMEIHF